MTTRLVLVLTTLAAVPLLAQSDHKLEVFGGFAHQRENDTFTDARNGWVASQTAYIRPWIGVEVELSGLYGSFDSPAFGDRPSVDDLDHSQQTYLVGPRLRLLTKERFTASAHALFGVSQYRFESPLFVDEFPFPSTSRVNPRALEAPSALRSMSIYPNAFRGGFNRTGCTVRASAPTTRCGCRPA